ncbi:WD40 repeat-like protein [Lichtheimia hyalospora FSU 10163]|nr:WD40 repeat-like protein [Lichtheimia hyalospora FSU 10163]
MSYRDVILDQLVARNSRELVFHEMVVANQKLLNRLVELQKNNTRLEAKVKRVQGQNDTLSRAAEYAQAQGSPEAQQKTQELERRIHELNNERAELYKTQGSNAQRLVEMNDKLRIAEEKEKQNTTEIKRLTSTVKQLSAKCELQIEQLREKDVTIQIIHDELQALQLEIKTTDEKNTKLKSENAQLLQRWLDKMNQEAEKMNEATEFYETFLEQARNAGKTVRKSGGKWIMQPSTSSSTAPSATVIVPTKAFKKLKTDDAEVYCVRASTTGSMFAAGGAGKKIRIFDGKTGNPIVSLSGSLGAVTSIAFSATDELVLGASTDRSTRIWDLKTNRSRLTLTGHVGDVSSAEFTADTKRVVTGSYDRTVKLWDLQRGYCARTIFNFSSCNDLALVDAEGQTLVTGNLDSKLRVWDTRSGSCIKELSDIHKGQITSVSVSPDGSSLLTNSRDDTLKILDLRMYNVVATLRASTFHNGVNWSRSCYSPDGCYVAAGSENGILHVWNTKTQALEKAVQEHSGIICGVSWNPSGECLYTADKKKTICMWDTALH